MTKSSEKSRLRQIPSSEDMEAKEGLPEGVSERSDQPRGRVELTRPGVSTKEPERSPKLMQPQEELVLQQVPKGWQGSGHQECWAQHQPGAALTSLAMGSVAAQPTQWHQCPL